MIRECTAEEFEEVLEIINAAAMVYRSVIPADRWHDPYMSAEYLRAEIGADVRFFGLEQGGELLGVMGIQDVGEVTLIRHAYVRPGSQRSGVGGMLLAHLRTLASRPVLMGTWADATWAIDFYEKHGFRRVSRQETGRLLRTYWDIPERQMETSVVLADGAAWKSIVRSEAPMD